MRTEILTARVTIRHIRETSILKFLILTTFLLVASAVSTPCSFAQSLTRLSLPEAPHPRRQTFASPGSYGGNSQHTRKDSARDQKQAPAAASNSPGHIYWVIPAFKVNYGSTFTPLTPKEKFQEWAQGAYDPLGLAVGAFEAGALQHSPKDGFCGYGEGWGAYGECFGSMELDSNVSSFIGDFVLTVAFHQDPRYFRLGKGSFLKRTGYAISRVFVTYNDSGHNVFYTSALTGTVIAAYLSNFYYPATDVGVGPTMDRIGLDLGNTAIYNAAAEFWPDIHKRVHRLF